MTTMTIQQAFQRASEEMANGDVSFATGLVNSILEKEPNHLNALFLHALVLSVKKQWDEADRTLYADLLVEFTPGVTRVSVSLCPTSSTSTSASIDAQINRLLSM